MTSYDDEEEAPSSYQCVDCKLWSPKTSSGHTLISQQHGWRLLRVVGEGGRVELEWRCPTCWAKHKASKTGEAPQLPPGRKHDPLAETGPKPAAGAAVPPSAPSGPQPKPKLSEVIRDVFSRKR